MRTKTELECKIEDLEAELTELRSDLADLPPEPPKVPEMTSGQVWRDSHGRLGVVATHVGRGPGALWCTLVPFNGGRAIDWQCDYSDSNPGTAIGDKDRYGLGPVTYVAATLDDYLAKGLVPW